MQVFSTIATESDRHPVKVQSISRKQFSKTVPGHLAARCKTGYVKNYDAAARASWILDAQNPASVTKFEIRDVISDHLLPNGIPLLDHAIGAFATQPGWGKPNKVLKSLCKLRVSSQKSLLEIREIVVGQSTKKDYREAAEWIELKHKETREKYGFCLPALDVENLQLELPPYLANWEDVRMELMLSDVVDTEVAKPRPDCSPSKLMLPVLLMYGSIGLQLHVRLLVSYHGPKEELHVQIHPAGGSIGFVSLQMKKFLPAVGAGIEEDIRNFISAVYALDPRTAPSQKPRSESPSISCKNSGGSATRSTPFTR